MASQITGLDSRVSTLEQGGSPPSGGGVRTLATPADRRVDAGRRTINSDDYFIVEAAELFDIAVDADELARFVRASFAVTAFLDHEVGLLDALEGEHTRVWLDFGGQQLAMSPTHSLGPGVLADSNLNEAAGVPESLDETRNYSVYSAIMPVPEGLSGTVHIRAFIAYAKQAQSDENGYYFDVINAVVEGQ
jgi:hypothetical protein